METQKVSEETIKRVKKGFGQHASCHMAACGCLYADNGSHTWMWEPCSKECKQADFDRRFGWMDLPMIRDKTPNQLEGFDIDD